jgi:hypothetical protein
MTTIFERVAVALDNLSPSVPYASSIYIPATGSVLPDVFLVYNLVSSPPEQHGDDTERMRSYRVQINIWSKSGLVSLPDLDGVMTTAGFMKAGKTQLPYSQDTGHFGLANDYVYVEDGV